MSILVDTSVWINYLRGTSSADTLDLLIEENLVVTNQLILAEILPHLYIRNQKNLIGLFSEIKQFPVNIDWKDIIQMRITCLKNGLNGVGIPDLIIAQNAIQGNMRLLSADKHFTLMAKHIPLTIYQEENA
jgi:predicted nucleic acid-binding protein